MQQQCWLDDPAELIDLPWPTSQTKIGRFNGCSRLVLWAGVGFALWRQSFTPLMVAAAVIVIFAVLFCSKKLKPKSEAKFSSSFLLDQMSGPSSREWYADPYLNNNGVPRDMVHLTNNMLNQQLAVEAMMNEDLGANHNNVNGVPLVFDGSVGGVFPSAYKVSHYPNHLNNPGPFDYYRAVRSAAPPVEVKPVDYLRRMMQPIGVDLDLELTTNPIPDPTHMAQMPFWNTPPDADVLPWANRNDYRYLA